jgi:hypothetical protein
MANISSSKSSTSTPATKRLDDFLDKLAAEPPRSGKLIFAIDATASRQETWDKACHLQAEMFREAAATGSLEIKLIYYRGSPGECVAYPWTSDSKRLSSAMSRIICEAGLTQIENVLRRAYREHDKTPVAGLVFVGDAMEEELDVLCGLAGKLRTMPCFMFQEGEDQEVEKAFRKIAKITGGAYAKFDAGAADQLRDLLRAVAAFAAGGITALEKKPGATLLLQQLRK